MNERIQQLAEQAGIEFVYDPTETPMRAFVECWEDDLEKFAELVTAHEREECAKAAGDLAKKWWSIHCDTNKHMETTRKAHDDFCALQAGIRARSKA